MAVAPPLLNLSTLIERDHVLIDGEPYDMRARSEVSILDLHRLTQQSERLDALMRGKDLTDEGHAEYRDLLRDLCRFILPSVPESVHAKLHDTHRLAIVRAFTTLLESKPTTPGANGRSAKSRARIPASTSPASSASTVATP